MKILLSHRYFWPDTPPYAIMLRSIAARLAGEGHDVTVFSAQPSYQTSSGRRAPAREMLDGFTVVRMPILRERKGNPPLRLVNLLAYARGLRRHILKAGDYDIVTASTFPPIAAARVAVSAANRIGARFVYHCMDIHPEVSLYSGQLQDGIIWRRLQAIDSTTCRLADAIVVLSRDMSDTLRARPGNADLQPHIINNFLLETFDETEIEDGPQLPKDKFTILFAGNIGNFQSLDSVIAAAHKLTDLDDVQFWFMGEGAAKKRLIALAGALNGRSVFFLPHQHHSVAQKLMGSANLNLVSLKRDIYRVSYPSKAMVSLSRSTPIFAVIEAQSELGRMVVEEKIGYGVTQSDPEAIAAKLRQAYGERDRQAQLRSNTKRLYQARFTKQAILERWCELIAELA